MKIIISRNFNSSLNKPVCEEDKGGEKFASSACFSSPPSSLGVAAFVCPRERERGGHSSSRKTFPSHKRQK